MGDKKKYLIKCWGDCTKFPELGDKCYLSWTDRLGKDQRAYEGEVRDDLLVQSVGWLLEDGYIEEAQDQNEGSTTLKGGDQ